jgi:hypothetical protein
MSCVLHADAGHDDVTNTDSNPQTDPAGATASPKRGRSRKGKQAPVTPRLRPKRVTRSRAKEDTEWENQEQQIVTPRRSHHKKITVESPVPPPTSRPPDPPFAHCQCTKVALNFAIATLNSIGAQVHAAVAQLTPSPPQPPPLVVSSLFQPLIQQLMSSSHQSSRRSDRSPSASPSRSHTPHRPSHHHSTSSSSSSHHRKHHDCSAHRADRSP